MNVVYESDSMVVVDDREFLTDHQAVDLLIAGGTIYLCDPPDFCAENEFDIHSAPFSISILDIMSAEYFLYLSDQAHRKIIYEYIRGYELSR